MGYNRLRTLGSSLALNLSLTELTLEGNNISSIKPILHLKQLMELYVAHNSIASRSELYNLRLLPRLVVADFFGNPVCSEALYREFVVFFVRSVKVRGVYAHIINLSIEPAWSEKLAIKEFFFPGQVHWPLSGIRWGGNQLE